MALTEQTQLNTADPQRLIFAVDDGDQIYSGGYVGLGGAGHAKEGFAFPYSPAGDVIPLGFANNNVLGDGTIEKAVFVITEGLVVKEMSVTGAAGDASDVGAMVYASDDNTFTLTDNTFQPIGVVVKPVAPGTADVYCFSFSEMLVDAGL